MTLWEVDIYAGDGHPDREGISLTADARDLGLSGTAEIASVRSYLLDGDLTAEQAQEIAESLLADKVVERTVVAPVGDAQLADSPVEGATSIHVMPKAGVMDPVAASAKQAMADAGVAVDEVRTMRKYWVTGLDAADQETLAAKLLANDSIEQVVVGPLEMDRLQVGSPYTYELITVPIRSLDDDGLMKLSSEGQLYLTLIEMQTIKAHFEELGRDPTDIELESVAQTWSEHCSHKTLAGRIAYRDENGEQRFENMLKETIFNATVQIREQLGEDDWCVSVFKDNAGIVRFDEEHNVVFKVETHNHPSALEPYGGANTGIGGVIRDPLGTGLGAKPICNTDVFCFADPSTSHESLPPGVLHPRRVMNGVVSGVRDYGNRMGIPTVNGAVYFDDRYLGNPLVYCGNVGLIPRDKSFKEVMNGDLVVAIGGRTGRDGIHGATFSSAELTSESETLSGGAVQIGNAITEKMVLDVLLEARDQGLYTAVTDCGAGGFSSAVGEMGEDLGVVVWLEKAPLKYDGLSYTEVWISEAQERMVFSVPESNWEAFKTLCESEGVEATVIGQFEDTGRLHLTYHGETVGDVSMAFLHDGRPPIVRDAHFDPGDVQQIDFADDGAMGDDLMAILGSLNVASKEWVIRQYDHEVQAGSVIKPLVGVENDGPGDASVVRPVLGSNQALAISCGMNPHFGDYDPYHMAASAIDEALRNCVAVGADPSRIAILDNFCWGYTDRPETLGSLVRAALACKDVAISMGTPFISGKDSLNNEFSYFDEAGEKQTISIPPTLLISAMGQVPDAANCVTMDLKTAGNAIYLVGQTSEELGGSHWSLVRGLSGGQVPRMDTAVAKPTFEAVYRAISSGLVRACHDLSEGGLAVAAAEMAFAGGLGIEVNVSDMPLSGSITAGGENTVKLFSESNTRFLCEVSEDKASEFEACFAGLTVSRVGSVTDDGICRFTDGESTLIESTIIALKEAWQKPLRW